MILEQLRGHLLDGFQFSRLGGELPITAAGKGLVRILHDLCNGSLGRAVRLSGGLGGGRRLCGARGQALLSLQVTGEWMQTVSGGKKG